MTDETEKYRNGRFADTVVLTIVRHTNSVYESIWTAYDGDQLVYFDHHCDDDRDFYFMKVELAGDRLSLTLLDEDAYEPIELATEPAEALQYVSSRLGDRSLFDTDVAFFVRR